MLELYDICYSYSSPTGKTEALSHITETISPGITAVIGHTGSGKTTLSEIIGGITAPSYGTISLNGKPLSEGRKKIGIVFQYPEYQLFAETVYDDIAYGPKNLGLKGKELDDRVKESARLARLSDKLLQMPPYSLSGGQKRLAALAGILAMKPEVLILDEPAAGLDPYGRKMMFSVLKTLISENDNMIIVFVTHSMEDAAQYADDIIILNRGTAAAHGKPEEILSDYSLLASCSLDVPETMRLSIELKKRGIDIGNTLTVSDAYDKIMNLFKED